MYCQFCGQQLTAGTNYCKQCGAATMTTAALTRPPARVPNTASIVWAIAVLGVGGLGVIFGTAIPLFALVGNSWIVLAAMALGLLALSAGIDASRPDDLIDRGDLALELPVAECVRTYYDALADPDLDEIPLVELRAHPQRRQIA